MSTGTKADFLCDLICYILLSSVFHSELMSQSPNLTDDNFVSECDFLNK